MEIWGCGAVRGGKALYIDPYKLEFPELLISRESIRDSKDEIIKAAGLVWTDEALLVFNSEKAHLRAILWDTKRSLFYKIEDNRTLLSEDGDDWDVLQVEIVDDREGPPRGPDRIVVYMIVYLECKWFKGDYKISSIPD